MMKSKLVVLILFIISAALSGCQTIEKHPWIQDTFGKTEDANTPVDPEKECERLTEENSPSRTVAWLCRTFKFFCDERQIRLKVPHKAEIDLSKYKTIAFTKLDGDYGDAFAAAYKELLQKNSHLKVVDRTQLQKLIKQMEINESDLLDEKNRPKLGKLLPAGLMVTGSITSSSQEPLPVPSIIPCPYNIKQTCTINTRTATSTMKGVISVIDVETGESLKDRRLYSSEEDSNTALNKLIPDPINIEELHEKNVQVLASDMIKATADWKERRRILLYVNSDIPKLNRGILEAKSNRIEKAKEIFAKAIEDSLDNPEVSRTALAAARFNLAVLRAYLGDHASAEILLSQVLDDTEDDFPATTMRKINDCLEKENKRRLGGD